ncbi:MAG TPA: hypothetical protein VML95_09525 [Longimicrobiales bacterium]|nr:hypothetical protein [Longimicrobiales bacterium]
MSAEEPDRLIANRRFNQPLEVEGGEVAPSYGLFQPCYPLSEADFLRLQKSNSVMAAIGGGLTSFALTLGLPLLVAYLRQPSTVPSVPEMVIVAISLVTGLLLLGLATHFSSDRRSIMKKVNEHFRDNPAEPEFRIRRND